MLLLVLLGVQGTTFLLLYTSVRALKTMCSSSVGVIGGMALNDTKCGTANSFCFAISFHTCSNSNLILVVFAERIRFGHRSQGISLI